MNIGFHITTYVKLTFKIKVKMWKLWHKYNGLCIVDMTSINLYNNLQDEVKPNNNNKIYSYSSISYAIQSIWYCLNIDTWVVSHKNQYSSCVNLIICLSVDLVEISTFCRHYQCVIECRSTKSVATSNIIVTLLNNIYIYIYKYK